MSYDVKNCQVFHFYPMEAFITRHIYLFFLHDTNFKDIIKKDQKRLSLIDSLFR